MNNSIIVPEKTLTESNEELLNSLQEEEAKLVKIIAAIRDVKTVKGWVTLQELVFGPLTLSLRKELLSEAKKDDPDPKRLNRLAGQLKWADRYANLDILEGDYSSKLLPIKQKLHG